MQTTDDTVKLAGLSVEEVGKDTYKYHFHASASEDKRVGVQIQPPHTQTFSFLKLPRKMSRVKAAEFIRTQKPYVSMPDAREYLDGYIERMKTRQERTRRNGSAKKRK